MNVLDIGSGINSVVAQIFESEKDLVITRMDINPDVKPDILHDITQRLPEELHGKFDLVMASHVLEHIDRDYVIQSVKNIAEAVKMGGELWIMVPSFEWAANQIRKGNDGPVIQLAVFGGQRSKHDYHKAGFTLMDLRQLMDVIGFATRKAYQAPFGISLGNQMYDALQNVIIGFKYQEVSYAVPESETEAVDVGEFAGVSRDLGEEVR